MHDLSVHFFQIRNVPNDIKLDFNLLKMLARKMISLRRLTIRDMDNASEETKDALRLFVGEVLDRSLYLCDLTQSHYIQLSAITSTISTKQEHFSTLKGVVHYNGQDVMQFPFTDNNIWSPELLIRWYKREE